MGRSLQAVYQNNKTVNLELQFIKDEISAQISYSLEKHLECLSLEKNCKLGGGGRVQNITRRVL